MGKHVKEMKKVDPQMELLDKKILWSKSEQTHLIVTFNISFSVEIYF